MFFHSILSSLYILTGFNVTNTAKWWWANEVTDESHIMGDLYTATVVRERQFISVPLTSCVESKPLSFLLVWIIPDLFVAFCIVAVHHSWDLPSPLLDSILDIILFCCPYKVQNRSRKPCITSSLCSHLQPVLCSALVVVSLVTATGRVSSVVFHLHQIHTLNWEELVAFSQKLTH